MERLPVGRIELAYEAQGTGEPVLLIHGAHIADAFLPVMGEPALRDYRLIRYHRRGLGESRGSIGASPTSVDEQVDDALAVLDALGVETAHVVGHSGGGLIALELALREPGRVASLALLEPAIMTPGAAAFMAWMEPIVEQYRRGDAAGAVRSFLAGIGDHERSLTAIERNVPGAIAQATRDAARFFESELTISLDWSLRPEDVARVTCPVLSVLGAESTGLWVEGRQLLHQWFPGCVDADIDGTGHLLQIEQPGAVAEALARFVAGVREGRTVAAGGS